MGLLISCLLLAVFLFLFIIILQGEKSKKKRKRRPGQSQVSSYSTSIYMILYFNSDFNNLDYHSLQNTYDSFVSKHLMQFQCPNHDCPHNSHLRYCTSYRRYVFYDIDSFITLNVSVFVCPDCGSYHAILPSFLLPFHSYTYTFIMSVLYLYFFGSSKGNKSRTCNAMHISRKTLDYFLNTYSKEEVRAAKRNIDTSRLKAALKNHPTELHSFIIEYFCSSERIIFLLPDIRRFFLVIYFIPPE